MKPQGRTRVLSVFGTRPEAIKMAPVVKALESAPGIESKVCVTAQHRTMLDQALSLFEIEPDYDLNVMKDGQDLFDLTSGILLGMRKVLQDSKPHLVLVHGDTTTCLVAALAAFYEGIDVAHVEAGLRTGNLRAPFPEEANRSLVSKIAKLHFAPTKTAKENLLNEGIGDESIYITGNTVIDALLSVQSHIHQVPPRNWCPNLPEECIEQVERKPERVILVTGHRRESFGQGFIDLCRALRTIAEQHPNWLLIYPVHLNPNVREPVFRTLSGCENILLIEPQDYLPFVWLLNICDIVITDSGGIQEEAPSLGKPVLVTRETTERPEAIAVGTVRLVGTSPESIVHHVFEILSNDDSYQKMSEAHNPYGDGLASKRIVEAILDNCTVLSG